ncbi:MAG: hypothetical protein QOC54_722 [Baekduia sp.]|jgi:hypothetical protein|nr:hypothetical protein [Baekduia sp.]
MTRIRVGEAMSALGAIGLLGLLFFDWLGVSLKLPTTNGTGIANLVHLVYHGSLTGWGTLGWLMDVLLAVAIFGGLCLPYMVAKRTSPAWPVGAAVLTWSIGAAVVLILVVRLVFLAQDDSAGLVVTLQLPAYAGVLFAALIPLGAFLSLKDERKDSAEARAYTPPPPRSVPGS